MDRDRIQSEIDSFGRTVGAPFLRDGILNAGTAELRHVAKETGVPFQELTSFVREERSLKGAPSNNASVATEE